MFLERYPTHSPSLQRRILSITDPLYADRLAGFKYSKTSKRFRVSSVRPRSLSQADGTANFSDVPLKGGFSDGTCASGDGGGCRSGVGGDVARGAASSR